jgi:hypothetical protein
VRQGRLAGLGGLGASRGLTGRMVHPLSAIALGLFRIDERASLETKQK